MQVIDSELVDFSIYPAYLLNKRSSITSVFDCCFGIWKLSFKSCTSDHCTKWRITFVELWQLDFIIYSPKFWFKSVKEGIEFNGFFIKSFSLIKIAFFFQIAFFRLLFRFHNTTGFDSINSVHTV